MPHFMASYRLVYGSREMILRHKWASIYVPAILVAYIALALWDAQNSPALVIVLVAVASGYLAWHYTGQVWGMMASYAYLAGTTLRAQRAIPHSDGTAHSARVARHVVSLHAASEWRGGAPAVRADQRRDDRGVSAWSRSVS